MCLKQGTKSFFQSSAFLYVAVTAIILLGVDLKKMAVNHSGHLFTKYINEELSNDLDGAHYYESYVRLNPQDPQGYINLGICYYRLGEEKKAIAAYQMGEKLNAGSASVPSPGQ